MSGNGFAILPELIELLGDDDQAGRLKWKLSTLNDADQRRLLDLAEPLSEAGCEDPLGWAYSEIRENIAQRGRFALLRELRLIADGTDVECLAKEFAGRPELVETLQDAAAAVGNDRLDELLKGVADYLMGSVAYLLDDAQPPVGLPGWALVEIDDENEKTGRDIGGLHEDWQEFRIRS